MKTSIWLVDISNNGIMANVYASVVRFVRVCMSCFESLSFFALSLSRYLCRFGAVKHLSRHIRWNTPVKTTTASSLDKRPHSLHSLSQIRISLCVFSIPFHGNLWWRAFVWFLFSWVPFILASIKPCEKCCNQHLNQLFAIKIVFSQ